MTKHLALPLRVATVALAFASVVSSSHAQNSIPFTTTWSAAPQQAGLLGAEFDNLAQQTLRQILRTSISGTAIRVQILNVFGQTPITVSDVHVASAVVNSDGSPTSSTVAKTDHVLTFGGFTKTSIPAGQALSSDPVAFAVPTSLCASSRSFHEYM